MPTTTNLIPAAEVTARPRRWGLDRVTVLERELDFAAHNGGVADIFNLLKLPANCTAKVFVKLLTAEGGAATIDIVTTEDTPQVFLDDGSINGTANTWLYGDGADGDAAVKELVIPVATTLNVVCNTASVTVAKIHVVVVCTQLIEQAS